MSVTRQQRAKKEEKNRRGGEIREEACGGERKRIGRTAADLLHFSLLFSPFADVSPTSPSSTSAISIVSPTCHRHVDSHDAKSARGLERRNFAKRWARTQNTRRRS